MIETRLEVANGKFNELTSQNKELREKIDDLRADRVVFDKVFGKLEKDLLVKRQSLAKLIEEVGKVFNKRDLAIERLR